MRPLSLLSSLILLFSLAASAGAAQYPGVQVGTGKEKIVMGWLESVFIRPWNLRLTAKLDTGANTSSLHADQIERFTRDGKDWVRFSVSAKDEKKSVQVERPVIRTAYIKERMARSSKREVVKLTICKNGRDYETEFTLVDRSNFNYPLLLGRSFLENIALVDASATFLYKADNDPCKSQAPDTGER